MLRHHRGGLLPGDDPEGKKALVPPAFVEVDDVRPLPANPLPQAVKGAQVPTALRNPPGDRHTPLPKRGRPGIEIRRGVNPEERVLSQPLQFQSQGLHMAQNPSQEGRIGVEPNFHSLSSSPPMVAPKGKKEEALSRALPLRGFSSLLSLGERDHLVLFLSTPRLSARGFSSPRSG